MSKSVTLDGHSLSIADVVAVARHNASVALDPKALAAVTKSREAIEAAAARGQTIYGVNTGFGKLAHVRIPPDQARQLQLNLIRSHASGVGEPLPPDAVRAMMLLRANVLVRGTSGVRPVLPELLVEMLNRKLHPTVPSQGSVGASGDLAPLSHLALAMIGEGDVKVPRPITLEAKEGLAFVNGTQAQTGLAALLVTDAWTLWRSAHAAAAMSLEAVRGSPDPFDARIHDARPHPWQQRSAALLRDLLADSEIRESHRENDPRVQDAYSLRCTPQVLGAVGEALAFAERLVTTELNAATVQIAKDVWNRWYAPVFHTRDVTLLGVYAHMVDEFLYLPDYPIGHMIASQIEQQMENAGNVGAEFERMAKMGNVTPDLWMKNATGAPVGPEALLGATEKALERIQ